jgi:hypothetical protein
MTGSLVFSLHARPAGKPAVDAPDALTVVTLFLWAGNKDGSTLVTIEAAQPAAMPAGRGFIHLFFTVHPVHSLLSIPCNPGKALFFIRKLRFRIPPYSQTIFLKKVTPALLPPAPYCIRERTCRDAECRKGEQGGWR